MRAAQQQHAGSRALVAGLSGPGFAAVRAATVERSSAALLHGPSAPQLVAHATTCQQAGPAVASRGSTAGVAAHAVQRLVQEPQQQGVPAIGSSRRSRRRATVACRAASSAASASSSDEASLASVPSTASGKLISKTEVAAFIQRDDLMDQMYRWAIIEAGEGGVRNFGLPMNVEPFYLAAASGADGRPVLWGYKLGIFKEGTLVCEMGIMFDQDEVSKHEWVGRGDDGFPVLEGKVDLVRGKHFEIWKLCARPVDEQLRSTIRAFCTGLVTALNRYYAFGSVFVDDAQ